MEPAAGEVEQVAGPDLDGRGPVRRQQRGVRRLARVERRERRRVEVLVVVSLAPFAFASFCFFRFFFAVVVGDGGAPLRRGEGGDEIGVVVVLVVVAGVAGVAGGEPLPPSPLASSIALVVFSLLAVAVVFFLLFVLDVDPVRQHHLPPPPVLVPPHQPLVPSVGADLPLAPVDDPAVAVDEAGPAARGAHLGDRGGGEEREPLGPADDGVEVVVEVVVESRRGGRRGRRRRRRRRRRSGSPRRRGAAPAAPEVDALQHEPPREPRHDGKVVGERQGEGPQGRGRGARPAPAPFGGPGRPLGGEVEQGPSVARARLFRGRGRGRRREAARGLVEERGKGHLGPRAPPPEPVGRVPAGLHVDEDVPGFRPQVRGRPLRGRGEQQRGLGVVALFAAVVERRRGQDPRLPRHDAALPKLAGRGEALYPWG